MDESAVHPTNGPIKVLVVDDSETFRYQMRALLEMESIEVVAEAGNGWEAIRECESHRPDVVLMDQNMPALSGIAATRHIKANQPLTRVIFIAAEEAWREEALDSGAEAYFVKGDALADMLEAIKDPSNCARFRQKRTLWAPIWRFFNKLLWPVLGGLLGIAVLAATGVLPVIVVPALQLFSDTLATLYGLK